jgi:hypothetical protein
MGGNMITEKDREEAENIAGLYAPYDCDEMAAGYVSTIRAEAYNQGRKDATSDAMGYGVSGDERERIRAESAEQAVKDHREIIDDYRRLTKELDIALNGDFAAKQASLCDIVAQVESLGTIPEIILRSSEQARKEAADRAEVWLVKASYRWPILGSDIASIRRAIIGTSTPVSTDSEKLAIAVKALEEILYRHGLEAGVAADCCHIANTALKEIQK